MITVDFADWSSNITLDLYGKDAQQLLPYRISEIQQKEVEVITITISFSYKQNLSYYFTINNLNKIHYQTAE